MPDQMPKNSPSMDFGPTTQQFDSVYSHDALQPGTRLGGYQIIEVLGRGGFGIVYLALDSSLQRQVAIKEYLPADLAMRCEDGQVWVRPGADPAAYAAGMVAFLSEAKMLARFDHPSLARVHTFWEENRSAYMVMPYYEGRTLAALLAEMKAPPDEAWLRSLLTPLLSALSTLHNAQCLHLDISPDNIIVLKDGRPVLLDFGVASRLATDKTMPLTALLNPAYAPIEQYSETATLPQGPWSDLYALASVLHFAIAGRPPARATVRAVEDPQRPLAETVAARAEQFPGLSYSESFLAAIDKALAVKPRERPRSAAEFQMLLDNMPPPALRTAPEPQGFASPLGNTASPLSGHNGGEPRMAPTFAEPPREAWFAAEPSDAPPKPARSRAPLLIATVAAVGLSAVGGWAWLQRQPSLAQITAADLPPAVVARIPKAASAAASGNPVPPPQVAAQPVPAPPLPATTAQASAPGPAPDLAEDSLPPTAAGPAAAGSAVVASPATAPSTTAAGPQAPAAAAATDAATPAATTAAATTAATPAATPAAGKPPAPQATSPAPAKTAAAAPARPRKPAKTAAATPTAPAQAAEPNNPRAVCGTRSNFALVYCMQQQCKRWKFTNHPQCIEMERRGEL